MNGERQIELGGSSVMNAECVACGAHHNFEVAATFAWITLARCPVCRSLTSVPRPTPTEQFSRHDNADYFDHPYFQQRRVDQQRVDRRARIAIDHVASAVDVASLKGSRYLDVGCDTGSFALAFAKQTGACPEGIDIAARAVAEANRNGLKAVCAPLESAPAEMTDYAVISATDVIEHLVDPVAFLAEVRQRLKPGGVLYFETPNVTSLVYAAGRLAGKMTGGRPRWVFERLFPGEHVQYFSRAGLRIAAERSGLTLVSCDERVLPSSDIAASPLVTAALAAMQAVDVLRGSEILLCGVMRR
jgi:2-polyprenyl-3-methyl-5-hydroxy-6-metoxy-1,4-benzoquinol methylase